MNNTKANTILLLAIITFSLALGLSINKNVLAASTAEPRFEGFTAEGLETFEGINFPNGTLITVEYSVDRNVGVSGVVIVGNGSKLELDPSVGLDLNFSYSYRDRTYYEGTFNLTENTIFKGYGWIGLVTNGTYEQVEIFNHLGPWHYLFVNEHGTPPEFHSIVNATQVSSIPNLFYAPSNQTNHTIVISYRVYGAIPEDNVTLVLSAYRDKISNASLNIFDTDISFIPMVWVNTSNTQYEVFNTTINFTERTIYFCANNSFGWDTWGVTNELQDTLNIYRINNGFYFESKTVLSELHTDVDTVDLVVTSYNSTEPESFGIQYFVVESSTNDTEIVPWTMSEGILAAEYNITKENGYNDTIREFNVSLGIFNLGNIIYYEGYNIYKDEIYNETVGHYKTIKIYNSVPQLKIHPLDKMYTNNETVTFTCIIITVRGNITGVLFDYGDGSPLANLTSLVGIDDVEEEDYTDDEYIRTPYTYSVAGASVSFTVTLYVNSSLGTTNSTSNFIYLDFTAPSLDILHFTNNETAITNGYVEFSFNYSDDYSGILFVYIDWDDGTVLNVTNDYFAFHYYVKSGNYTVTFFAKDRAGNVFNSSIDYNIVLPESMLPTTPSPYAISATILSLIVVSYVIIKKRKLK